MNTLSNIDFNELYCSLNNIIEEVPEDNTKITALKNGEYFKRIFTPIVTLWAMIKQRLDKDHTLDKVISDIKSGAMDYLSPNKKLSKTLKSENTSSFSQARKRMDEGLLKEVFEISAKATRAIFENDKWKNLKCATLDGTSQRVDIPSQEILKKYPMAKNSNQQQVSTLVRAVYACCLSTGAIIGAKWGSFFTGEVTMAIQMMKTIICDLFVTDSGFGIFHIFQVARENKRHLLSRLSLDRAKRLAKLNNTVLRTGMDKLVRWSKSSQDKTEAGLSEEDIIGRLICYRITIKGFRSKQIYLFTDLVDKEVYKRKELIDLFGRRWEIETDFRNLKSQMELDNFNCKSPEMINKEMYAGLIAYNLIRYFIAQASKLSNIEPKEISFAKSTRRITDFLLKIFSRSTITDKELIEEYNKLLLILSESKIAVTKKNHRIQPRKIRPRRSHKYPTFTGSRKEEIKKLMIKYA